jgi:hypothetical protein
MKTLWISRPTNVKTGPIPTAYVGSTMKECRDSCKTALCPFLSVKDGGDPNKPTCYAYGTPSMGARSAQKAYKKNPEKYSLSAALEKRHPKAKYLRISAIGDPVVMGPGTAHDILSEAVASNLKILGYTHGWRQAYWWKDVLRASCGSLEECDEAISQGWKCSVVLKADHLETKGRVFRTPKGSKGVVCPAFHNETLTCNDCGMCCSNRVPVVGFPDHGPGSR